MTAVVTCFWPGVSSAASVEQLDRRIQEAHAVLSNVLKTPDRGIPRDLLQKAQGLAVFPGVLKAGIVLGISFGNGVVLRRDHNTGQWSNPVFFRIRGGSVGVQIGAQATDLILLVMSEQVVERLLEERFTLGADASIAAGPVGRGASAETNIRFDAGILSYSRSKGLFVGLSLKGAALEPDMAANEAYHGKGLTVQDVLYENKGALSNSGRALIGALEAVTGSQDIQP